MNLFSLRKTADRVLHPVVSLMARARLSANQWTLVGALIAIACAVVLLYGYIWQGVLLMVVRGIVDHVDGYVARTANQRSTFGAIMDDVSDRWSLGIIYAGGCLALSAHYPHVLLVLGAGLTGALCNVIIKLSIYAEAQHDGFREAGKFGHPVDVVGIFGSAEFIIYFGGSALITAIVRDPRPMLVGAWAVAVLSHLSLLQRMVFAWQRYRQVDPFDPAGPSDPSDPEGSSD